MEDRIRDYKMRKVKRRFGRIDSERLPKDKIKWITSNGEHIPLNKETGEAVGSVGENRNEKLVLSNAESLPIRELRNGNTPQERQETQEVKKAEEDYKKAVESGDVKSALRLVRDFAKKRGYTLGTFHGTPSKFTSFQRKMEGIHAGELEQARDAVERKLMDSQSAPRLVYPIGYLLDHMDDTPLGFRKRLVSNIYSFAYNRAPNDTIPFEDFGDIHNPQDVSDWVSIALSGATGKDQDQVRTMKTKLPDYNYVKKKSNIMPLYARINNPITLGVDVGMWVPSNVALCMLAASGEKGYDRWKDMHDIKDGDLPHIKLTKSDKKALKDVIKAEGDFTIQETDDPEKYQPLWDKLEKILRGMGYDGIKYLNETEGDVSQKGNYSYLILSPNDLMSAQPITRDEDGNIIPLSERFPGSDSDVRGLVNSKENEQSGRKISSKKYSEKVSNDE